VEKFLPGFKDDLGVSAVIINSPKGRTVFSGICEYINSTQSNITALIKRQRNLSKPSTANDRREEFWRDYSSHDFDYIAKKYTNYGNPKEWIKYI
jgi:hypothetical protein